MREPVRNMGASVRGRLLNIARERNQPFELVLTRYVLERLLYRLTTTQHRDRFVLKGAMLLTAWFNNPSRPTRDVDLLGLGDSDPEAMLPRDRIDEFGSGSAAASALRTALCCGPGAAPQSKRDGGELSSQEMVGKSFGCGSKGETPGNLMRQPQAPSYRSGPEA